MRLRRVFYYNFFLFVQDVDTSLLWSFHVHMITLLFFDYSLFFTGEVCQYLQTYSHMWSFKYSNELYLVSFNLMGFIYNIKVNSIIILERKGCYVFGQLSTLPVLFEEISHLGDFYNCGQEYLFQKHTFVHGCFLISNIRPDAWYLQRRPLE